LFGLCRFAWAERDEHLSQFYGLILKEGGVPLPAPPTSAAEMRKLFLEHAPNAKRPIQECDLRELEEMWFSLFRLPGLTAIFVVGVILPILAISLWQFGFPWAAEQLNADLFWGGAKVMALLAVVLYLVGWLTVGVAYLATAHGPHLWSLNQRCARASEAIWGKEEEVK
jgi:hypothetical protein